MVSMFSPPTTCRRDVLGGSGRSLGVRTPVRKNFPRRALKPVQLPHRIWSRWQEDDQLPLTKKVNRNVEPKKRKAAEDSAFLSDPSIVCRKKRSMSSDRKAGVFETLANLTLPDTDLQQCDQDSLKGRDCQRAIIIDLTVMSPRNQAESQLQGRSIHRDTYCNSAKLTEKLQQQMPIEPAETIGVPAEEVRQGHTLKVPNETPCFPIDNGEPKKWYEGSVSLALPCEEDFLSPLHCFVRKHCVEAFTAKETDVAIPRYGRSKENMIEIGQVGIRCKHCNHLPLQLRADRAQSYPSSCKTIYYAVETWLRKHSVACECMPAWVKKTLQELLNLAKKSAGGRRLYWEQAATQLGMIDTPRGIRFARKPGIDCVAAERSIQKGSLANRGHSTESEDEEAASLVIEDDRTLVSEYLFVLISQMESCKFSSEDRVGGRSNINKECPLGYPGFRCKHCRGRNGLGRYFPTTLTALALPNSDRNVYNHLLKCHRCPSSVHNQLSQLKPNAKKDRKGRGTRKLFFSRIWDRLHAEYDRKVRESGPVNVALGNATVHTVVNSTADAAANACQV